MARDTATILIRSTDLGARIAKAIAQQVIGRDNNELARSVEVDSFASIGGRFVTITVPQEWAVYVHEDTRPRVARPGGFLVFWANSRDDPRRSNKNVTVRRLSQEEFKRILEAERQRRINGQPPKVIITKRTRGTRGKKWFTAGEFPLRLPQELDASLRVQFTADVAGLLRLVSRDAVRAARADNLVAIESFSASIGAIPNF